jgi:hypothetical protein
MDVWSFIGSDGIPGVYDGEEPDGDDLPQRGGPGGPHLPHLPLR